jgi:hypothetical protein
MYTAVTVNTYDVAASVSNRMFYDQFYDILMHLDLSLASRPSHLRTPPRDLGLLPRDLGLLPPPPPPPPLRLQARAISRYSNARQIKKQTCGGWVQYVWLVIITRYSRVTDTTDYDTFVIWCPIVRPAGISTTVACDYMTVAP